MGPYQLNRAEGKFFGEGHETLDPEMLEPPVPSLSR